MLKPVPRFTTLPIHADDPPASVNDLIADVVAACATVRATELALHEPAVRKLRAIRVAGRLLALVQRSDGGRPLSNSSRGLTSYQRALMQAGISRQTANRWRRAAEIPDADFELFIVWTQQAGHDLTLAELLRMCTPKSKTVSTGRMVKLILSEAEYDVFQQQVGVLGAAYLTDTATQTVIAVLGHAYSGWLAAQTRRPRASGEGLALSPRL